MCHLPGVEQSAASRTPSSQAPHAAQCGSSASPGNAAQTTPNSQRTAQSPLPETQARFTGSTNAGQIWHSRGAPSYHGSSYFGFQSAASMMHMESPDLPIGMNGIHANIARSGLHRDEKGPYDHIWELVGYLPRRKAVVDQLVQRYFDELNDVHDCVDEATFRASYDAFWNRKWGDDDLTAVDLRWLSLLFMMLAFAVLLNSSLDATIEAQREGEKTSVQFFWACRKAIVLAPTFTGESPDLVRAGILVSRFLMYFGRKTEAWLTSSFAIRMAQAQGMHIDGESWGFPSKVLESRRRLWCKLYSLDRCISLAVGRPYTIHGKHCTQMNMRNIWVDDMTSEEAKTAVEQPLHEPTPTLYYRYQQQLSGILGDIHDEKC
ncbi:hypothetical protein NQ176_g5683 [Zarea fungicola]|uniref:Uncharacterized protein n=1 Tax=Zarea fungicola TaxID=93591 RepID=A0ACC1N9M1_9HYPO|nr:hypothetical protein NQ176_g5683 [Lecanicillium fungicola]